MPVSSQYVCVCVCVCLDYFMHMLRVAFPVLMGMVYIAYTPFSALIRELATQ